MIRNMASLIQPPQSRPLLAITLGDPAGIGPEIILKALSVEEVYGACRPLVIGDVRILERAAAWVECAPPRYEVITDPQAGLRHGETHWSA